MYAIDDEEPSVLVEAVSTSESIERNSSAKKRRKLVGIQVRSCIHGTILDYMFFLVAF